MLENEILRDLLISKIGNILKQDTLTFETLSQDEVVKRALKVINRTNSQLKRFKCQKQALALQATLRNPIKDKTRAYNGSSKSKPEQAIDEKTETSIERNLPMRRIILETLR